MSVSPCCYSLRLRGRLRMTTLILGTLLMNIIGIQIIYMGEKEDESNILVAIRVRPLSNKEANSADWDIIRVQDNLIIILDPIEKEFEAQNRKMLEVLHRSKEQRYAFDKIYRNEDSQKIYRETVQPLIKTVVSGKNATVFAYGPTGTGKTYTMLGNQDVYGLNVLAIRDIFELIRQDSEYEYSILITYVEIYNEMIRDLLIPTSGYLQLRDDTDKGITIAGVTEFKAQSTEQVMNLLHIGNKRRTTEATNANQTSSRSHAVFQINILKTPKTKNTNVETLSSKLSLIDLAGSERGTVTENRGIRLMEGAKINRSLLALANCINALGDKNKKGFFVPYRDSKLTRLLKDSLGGNCKTVMIANISPASSQFQETINSLKYANRAKNIKTKALTNKKLVSIHISEYKNIINDLRAEIGQLKQRLEKNSVEHPNEHEVEVVVVPRKEGAICVCGKVEESAEIKKIKEQVFQNFNERIQLRRALMEIEEQNSINMLDIKKKQGEIMILTKNQEEGAQEEIKNINRVIHTLKLSTQKNILKRQITNMQLMESMSATKKIRQEIPRRIRNKENRQFLEIIIRNHVLELQNIELEINLQIQEKIITDLKNIAMTQRAIITEKGIDFKLEDQLLEDDNIELEIDEDSDIPQEEGQDDDEDDPEIQRKFRRNRSAHKIQGKIEQQQDKREEDDRKKRVENNLMSFNGYAKKKEREKTLEKGNSNQSALNVNNVNSNVNIPTSNNNILDLNLRGMKVGLNEKLPFSIAPKDKKKK